MKRTELVHVAVAETSVIVRSGLVAVLKRMPDLIIQPVEITSLKDCKIVSVTEHNKETHLTDACG